MPNTGKAAFFTGAAPGLVIPTLPIAAALLRRGQDVTYYSTTPYRAAIERVGARFEPMAQFENAETQAAYAATTTTGATGLELARLLLEHTGPAITDLLPRLSDDPPDYIVHDSLCVWGGLLGRLLDVPAVAVATTFVANRWLMARYAHLAPSMILAAARRREHLRRFRQLTAALSKDFGLPRLGVWDVLRMYEPLTLVCTSRLFQPLGATFDPHFVFIGASFFDETDCGEIDARLRDDRPVVYIALGTIYDRDTSFFRACLDAFGNRDYQVVLKTGNSVNVEQLGVVPPNISLWRWVPSQVALLRRASLFVTHGGMNSVSEALYFGVPMLVVPQALEHGMVGRRVEQLGAGKLVTDKTNLATVLRDEADRLLADGRYQKASRRVGETLREGGGGARGADEILRYVERRSPR